MNPREAGFLLLNSHLGDPQRRPLTLPKLQLLGERVRRGGLRAEGAVDLPYLLELGCSAEEAGRILELLSETRRMERYVRRAEALGLRPLLRISPGYPRRLIQALGLRAPAVLWIRGEPHLLEGPCMSLVGSRELHPENRRFAREAGRQMALQGYTLVSGGARGADIAAQTACLEAGGRVISILADAITGHAPPGANLLFCAEDSFDLPFTPLRALSRNRIIHAMGQAVLVAQAAQGFGGTWAGTGENLRHRWSPVFFLDDGSPAAHALEELGATPVTFQSLSDLSGLHPAQTAFSV